MTNIQNSLALAFLPGYLFSCQYEQQLNKSNENESPPVTQNPDEASDQKLIRRYLEAIQLQGFEYLEEILHPTFKCINTNTDSINNSKDELELWKSQHEKWKHISFEEPTLKSIVVNRGILKGKWTLVWTFLSAMDKRNLQPLKLDFHMAVKTEDNKIAEVQTWHKEEEHSTFF
ncbi:MAG: hypothetical protein WD431_05575 [Cyclobacteriaceae bacterium]